MALKIVRLVVTLNFERNSNFEVGNFSLKLFHEPKLSTLLLLFSSLSVEVDKKNKQ
jgi:hypothetical protein